MSITNGYATLVQVKQAIGMGTADTADDTKLELSIEAASRLIDDETERVFFASGTGVVRYFAADDEDCLDIDDAISISAVATDWDGSGSYATTLASTDYRTVPTNGLMRGRAWPITGLRALPWRSGLGIFPELDDDYPAVKITGNWGFGTAVPTDVTQACVTLSARLWKRGDAVFGVAGFGDMGAMRLSRTDPDVANALRVYKRSGGAAFA